MRRSLIGRTIMMIVLLSVVLCTGCAQNRLRSQLDVTVDAPLRFDDSRSMREGTIHVTFRLVH